MRRSRQFLVAWFLWLVCHSASLSAQGVLTGVIRNDSTGAPLAGVEVLINGTSFRTESNAQGRYLLSGLPPGTRAAFFRLVGYLPIREDVLLRFGDTTRVNVLMIPSTVVLSPVIVTGTPERGRGVGMGLEAFEERKKLGFGIFFDSTDLRRNDHRTLGDMARNHVGLYVPATRYGGGIIYNYRMNPPCPLFTYLDGVPRGVVDTKEIPIHTLVAAEIYKSSAGVPTEYGGARAACGVILLWTRRGP